MTKKKILETFKSKPQKSLTKEDASLILKSKGTKRKSNRIALPGGQAKSANLSLDEQDLQKEKDLLQKVMNGARNSHLVYLDRDFNFVRVNETYAKTCGFRPEDMIGKNHFDLYPHKENEAIFARVRDTGVPAEFHDRPFSFPDQPERGITYWDWTLTPVKDSSGTVVGLVFSLFETTERKKAGEALKQSEEKYRRIVETANEGIWVVDADRRTTYVNNKMAEILGYSAREMVGKSGLEFLDEEGRALSDLNIVRRQQGISESSELRLIRRDKSALWALVNSTPLFDGAGEFAGTLSMLTDITGRKLTEEKLRESEERYRSIFEGANDGIIACDLITGKFLFANTKMSSLIGYSAEEIYRLGIKDIHPPKDLPYVLEEFNRMAEGKITETRAIPVMKKGGGIVYCDIGSSFLGKTILIGFFRDTTARKEAEEQIKDLNEQLKRQVAELDAANKELDSFAYSISHDLRAPLRHISGFVKILVEDYTDRLDAEGRDYLDRVYRSSEKMDKLIEDLLYLSRIYRRECDRINFSVSMKASSVVEGLRASDPGRQVEVSIKEGLVAFADPGLAEIVLSNLLGNAWKFTSKTEYARIEFGALDHDGKTAYYVRDNGVGFDPENKGKLFMPFQRLHSEKEFEGLGIGLSIAARIIRRHGGRIWAEGEKGKGATFFFTLD